MDKRSSLRTTGQNNCRQPARIIVAGYTPAELRDDRQKTLLGKLLHRMAQSLNYDFDETRIKNGAYYPRGFAENESAQAAIRDGVKELLEGTRAIPVEVREDPHNQKPLTV